MKAKKCRMLDTMFHIIDYINIQGMLEGVYTIGSGTSKIILECGRSSIVLGPLNHECRDSRSCPSRTGSVVCSIVRDGFLNNLSSQTSQLLKYYRCRSREWAHLYYRWR